MAVIQLGAVCRADEDLLIQSIDPSPIEGAVEGKEDAFDDPPASFMGLFRLLTNLANAFPPRLFEVLGEIEEVEDDSGE